MKREMTTMNKALLSALSLTVALAFAAPLTVTSASAASTTTAGTSNMTKPADAPAKPMVKKHKTHKKHHVAAKKVDTKKTDTKKDQKKS
jgi:hypothetical protein